MAVTLLSTNSDSPDGYHNIHNAADCSDSTVYPADSVRQAAAQAYRVSTDQQTMYKRTEGRKIINHLIAQLSSIKYVQDLS